MSESKPTHPVVGIACAVSFAIVAVVFLLALFAKSSLSIAPWIVGALAAMGCVLGVVVSKERREG